MAPKTKIAALPSTMKELKDTLWKAADKLRGSMDASQYKDVILGLVFLKYVSDSFDERREQIRTELAADIAEMPPGHRRWRAWPVRQVALNQRAALADALTSLRWEQKQARERLEQLDQLTDLLMAGVTAGTITLASDAPSKGTT